MVKIIAWNIAQRAEAWRLLAGSDADIALLQETKEPPVDVAAKVSVDRAPWRTGASRAWRAAVVKLSDRIDVEWIDVKPLGDAQWGELGVSRPGTLAAAIVTPEQQRRVGSAVPPGLEQLEVLGSDDKSLQRYVI